MTARSQLFHAIIAILFVITGYALLGKAMRELLGDAPVMGYNVVWSVWTSTIMVALVWIWQRRNGSGRAEFGLVRPHSIVKAIGLGVIGGVVIYAATGAIIYALASIGVLSLPSAAPSATLVKGPDATLALVLSLLIMWINAAFGEEFLFRGFLMNRLDAALEGKWASGVLSALVIAVFFGAIHVPSQGAYGWVATGLAGFFLGLLFLVAKRNLWPVIIAHGLINSVSLIAVSLAPPPA